MAPAEPLRFAWFQAALGMLLSATPPTICAMLQQVAISQGAEHSSTEAHRRWCGLEVSKKIITSVRYQLASFTVTQSVQVSACR